MIQVLQHGVVTPDLTVSDVRKAHGALVCVVRDVLAGGSFVVIAAGTQDAIGTIDMHVPMDETHCHVGQLHQLHFRALQDFNVLH